MKTTKYITYNKNQKEPSKINKTAFLAWMAVLVVSTTFWFGTAIVYKEDYVPRAIAKLHHKEDKFLANHKVLHKKLISIRNSLT